MIHVIYAAFEEMLESSDITLPEKALPNLSSLMGDFDLKTFDQKREFINQIDGILLKYLQEILEIISSKKFISHYEKNCKKAAKQQ